MQQSPHRLRLAELSKRFRQRDARLVLERSLLRAKVGVERRELALKTDSGTINGVSNVAGYILRETRVAHLELARRTRVTLFLLLELLTEQRKVLLNVLELHVRTHKSVRSQSLDKKDPSKAVRQFDTKQSATLDSICSFSSCTSSWN